MGKAEEVHLGRVAALGCCICGRAAEVHHVKDGQGTGRKASDFETIPLCPDHHRLGGQGVAFHQGPKIWEKTFGRQRDMLAQVMRELERIYGKIDIPIHDKADRIRRKIARYRRTSRHRYQH